MEQERYTEITRKTGETEINLKLFLDGSGDSKIDTGVPFINHMLQLWAKHGNFHLELFARGDTDVDYHHTVEDIGICLGEAISKCTGDKKGITRYGHTVTPMDEALLLTVVDISGRGFLAYEVDVPSPKVGDFDTELIEEFMHALAINGRFTLHIHKLAGRNCHHIIEAIFKGLGRTLKQAVSLGEGKDVPSTKGVL